MIVHYLDASAIGGIETHVETVVRALGDAGHPAAVILHRQYDASPVRKRYEAAGLEVHVAGGATALPALFGKLQPSIIHTHGYKAGIFGRPLARLMGIPVISTFHAGERGTGRMRLYQRADEWTSLLAPRLAVSTQIAESLPFGATVMRNFVTLPVQPRREPSDPRFVFAGRLSHEKGPDLFCALAERFAGQGKFEMHGEGQMRAELEARFGEAVDFCGFAPAIAPVLAHTTALVMTSRREGLPMIALEAMAAGVPVIAPATGGLTGLINDGRNGFLFEPEDEASMEAAMERFLALDDDARRSVGEAARRTIRQTYSAQAVLPDLLAAYAAAGWKPEASTSTNVQSSAG